MSDFFCHNTICRDLSFPFLAILKLSLWTWRAARMRLIPYVYTTALPHSPSPAPHPPLTREKGWLLLWRWIREMSLTLPYVASRPSLIFSLDPSFMLSFNRPLCGFSSVPYVVSQTFLMLSFIRPVCCISSIPCIDTHPTYPSLG